MIECPKPTVANMVQNENVKTAWSGRESPISGEIIPDEYDSERVSGEQAMIRSIINDIIWLYGRIGLCSKMNKDLKAVGKT